MERKTAKDKLLYFMHGLKEDGHTEKEIEDALEHLKTTEEGLMREIRRTLKALGFKEVGNYYTNGEDYMHFMGEDLAIIRVHFEWSPDQEIQADLLEIEEDDLPEDDQQAEAVMMEKWESL